MPTPPPEQPGNPADLSSLTPPSAGAASSDVQDSGTILEITPSPAALATRAVPVAVPGYEVLCELGRGGMGAVLKGRDPELGRELAVKVLLERYSGDAGAHGRFVEEAQIGGRLQHPGVVPVYALGRLADGRPYFTMKLIEGRTLADLLEERADPARDLPRFLQVFQQICQTLAYAHSKGVIHRDLKPANVMVGAFGEVQVMDWGLAKALAQKEECGGVKKEPIAGASPGSSVGASSSTLETQAGAVLGTPAYMAPEQARGEVDRLDERCDVFGLGAILCVILTGRPPYSGGNAQETVARARRGDLAEAFARLEASGADAELVGLAKACLAAEPARRPADAGAAAEAVTGYLAGVQERLRKAELAKAAAQAKAAEERKRRRLTLVLAATVLLAVGGAGAGALWYQQDRAARAAEDARLAAEHARKAATTERDVTAALEEAKALGEQAKKLKNDPPRWEAALAEALSAVKRADGVLDSGVDDAGRLRGRVDAVRSELEALDRDRRMIARLEEARFQRTATGAENGWDNAGAAALYAQAFHDDDMDLGSLDPAEAAARIDRRAIRDDLLAALADWSNITTNKQDKERLRGVLKAADPDPASFRNRWNAASGRKDLDALRRLAASPEAMEQPTVRLVLFARRLTELGAAADAIRLLKEADARRPGDFWIAFQLAYASSESKPPATDEAIRYNTAALMLRRDSVLAHNNLGLALRNKGQLDEAIAELREAIELQPDYALAHSNLGGVLRDKGQRDEAVAECRTAVQLKPDNVYAHNSLGLALYDKHELDEAIAECRKAIELKPDYAYAHNSLGLALHEKHEADEAVAEYRKAIELKPDFAEAHNNLGIALRGKGRLDEAVAELRKAIEGRPGYALAHNNLGAALLAKGQSDEAITEYRTAVRLNPDYADAHANLGAALRARGQLDEAVAECRTVARLKPEDANAHDSLGLALYDKHEWDEAVAEFRTAIERKPDLAEAHNNLGLALSNKHESDEAVAEFRTAIEWRPDLAEAHNNLGLALRAKDQSDEAVAEFRTAIERKPDYANAHYNLGLALYDKGQWDGAIAEFRKTIEGKLDNATVHNSLGLALREKGQWDGAITEFRTAVKWKPDFALAHNNLGVALRGKGLLDEAIAEYRTAIEWKPDYAEAHNNLGAALYTKGRPDEAVAEYRKAVELRPDYADAHFNLGLALYDKRLLDEAIAEDRKVIELKPDYASAHNSLGNALRAKGRTDEAVAEFRKAIELTPDDALFHNNLGLALYDARRLDEAVAEFRRAIDLKPDLPDLHRDLGVALLNLGRFSESLAAFRRCHELGSKTPGWRYPSADWVREVEGMVRRDALLPALLRGAAEPASPAAGVAFADVCRYKHLYAAAARFCAGAFAAQPALADDLASGARYNAACYAALAGCGQGEDAATTDAEQRGQWRKQARDWLRADLALWTRRIDAGKPEDRTAAAATLQHWREDSDLTGVRDGDALAKLPADERDAWRKLWADVDALLKKKPK